MEHKTFTLKGKNIAEPVSQFVRHYYQEAFLSGYLGGFLMVYEDYSFLNSNQMMVCVRLHTTEHENGIVKIEVISGGAIMGDIFGSESRRINAFEDSLTQFCGEKKIEMVE